MKKRNSFVGLLLLLALSLGACSSEPASPVAVTPVPIATASPTEEIPVAEGLDGSWEGKLNVAGLELAITVHFQQGADQISATIDIPQQGAAGIPIHSISIDLPAVHFEMLEAAQLATFEGQLTDAGTLAGRFSQSGVDGTFELMRQGSATVETKPYTEEEVTFVNDDTVLAGTLSIPAGSGPFPSLIMISGSGAQTRDGTIPIAPGYQLFADLADHLTRNGITVLRYDDRGVGLSTGDREQATTIDFAADAEAGFGYLQTRPELAPDQVGLLGHSEGANIAAMIAARNPEVFATVALAGSALDGYEIILSQLARILIASGNGDQDVEAAVTQQRQVLDLVRANDREGLEQAVGEIIRRQLEALPADELAAVGDIDALAEQRIAAETDVLLSPWYRQFIDANPADDWAVVQTPVLAFFGELDVQVDAALNQAALENALAKAGNKEGAILVLPTANHLFQAATTGSLEEYTGLGDAYAPDLFETITAWLQERVAGDDGS